jgi:hypothetical protein
MAYRARAHNDSVAGFTIKACPRRHLSGVGNDIEGAEITESGLQVTLPKIVRILYMSVIDDGNDLLDEGDAD